MFVEVLKSWRMSGSAGVRYERKRGTILLFMRTILFVGINIEPPTLSFYSWSLKNSAKWKNWGNDSTKTNGERYQSSFPPPFCPLALTSRTISTYVLNVAMDQNESECFSDLSWRSDCTSRSLRRRNTNVDFIWFVWWAVMRALTLLY